MCLVDTVEINSIATVTLLAKNHSLANAICEKTFSIAWRGDIESISTAQKFYHLFDAPKIPQLKAKLFTEINIKTTIEWCNGAMICNTTDHSHNIVRRVQLGVKAKQNYKTPDSTSIPNEFYDPWFYIPKFGGDCVTHADWMTKALLLLGINASTEYIFPPNGKTFFIQGTQPHWLFSDGNVDDDFWTNKYESGYDGSKPPGQRGTLEGIYIDAGDKVTWKNNAPPYDWANFVKTKDEYYNWFEKNKPWNFHGACACAGHWWEITLFDPPVHDTKAEMCRKGGPVIKADGPASIDKF